MFDDDFLSKLPEDAVDRMLAVSEAVFNRMGDRPSPSLSRPPIYQDLIAAAALATVLASEDAEFRFASPTLGPSPTDNVDSIRQSFSAMRILATHMKNKRVAESLFAAEVERFSGLRNGTVMYRFTPDELERVQSLINEIRSEIQGLSTVSQQHRERLLRRLEQMQREFNETMSNMDKFWAFFGEAGVQLGRFGENVKPIVDRLGELADIVVRASDSGSKLLQAGSAYIPQIKVTRQLSASTQMTLEVKPGDAAGGKE